MAVTPESAANHLCNRSNWTLSNLKLHKILYLADMNYVGQSGNRLLSEDFEAWDYGPVVPSLYHRCKAFGAKPVSDVFFFPADLNGTQEGAMLDFAWERLNGYSAGQLVENTHWPGGAWAQLYQAGVRGVRISKEEMIDEYQKRVRQPERN